ncbi:oxidoreductase molybdopterin binding [Pseudarthrobacter chlorophenolicus A6]|uniref:Oxidoreductase molybdopterin binding n=1 Tax=Pseudarthrobacter chlorophenolicus (strain ATCC 700700 / DSM 12829 / CIP 107037 / JCM 12360 / KCTC 9906 / NCIMB 13794 / A6) TaxID=452863 RepID=B8HG72_PSECP|nr:oxidoreductase molybdopterin binding [Pseudarthrobacter chlorophenolicus A6]SDQ99356.1 DMSO/TMAO reductase YedYZ, molybdopterin-dependent catalytic subunit [Pseudarthrobacter chlorophenolicus]
MNSARQQATHDDGTRHGGLAEPSAGEQRERRPLGGHAAAAGVVSVAGGVVVGELLAGVWSPSVSPLTAVGGAVIDAVPPAVKDWAVSLFGTADKAALLAGMALVIAVLAAFAGVVERRRRFAGLAVISLFGLAGVAAVAGRAQATPVALALPVAAAAAAALILRLLTRKLKAWEGAAGSGNAPARRTFLRNLAAGAVLATAGGVLAGTWRGTVIKINDARARVALPRAAEPAPAIPAGAEAGVEGMPPLVTPVNDFYRIDTALVVPAVDPDTWVLRVTGMVQREVELTLADLLAKPLTERHITIACVSNPVGGDLIGNARWLGWPVREVLALAGPVRGADMVLSRSADGWTAGTPLEVLTDNRDAMLAVGMNGGPLPLEHGFPVRLVVPGLYGYVSATKWVTELKVTTYAEDTAYWTTRGWSDHGPIKLSSRIDVPRSGRPVNAGTVTFGGIAWAQHTGVSAVELRVNRGSWQPAELSSGISTDTWYQWKLSMDLTPGQYEVQVRATDLAGTVQDEASRPVVPDGATGFHTVRVDVKS